MIVYASALSKGTPQGETTQVSFIPKYALYEHITHLSITKISEFACQALANSNFLSTHNPAKHLYFAKKTPYTKTRSVHSMDTSQFHTPQKFCEVAAKR